MGSGNDVGDSIRECHATHFHSYVPRFGSVVNFGENVAVDIDHEDNLQTLFEHRMELDGSRATFD
jgi:hypothetical protein